MTADGVSNTEAVALIYAVLGSFFLGGLFIGSVTTLGRVVYYRAKGVARPRLLTRDVLVYGNLSVGIGLITAIRFLPPEVRVAMTTGNIGWALATSLPFVIAVFVYCYYELAVIRLSPPGDGE